MLGGDVRIIEIVLGKGSEFDVSFDSGPGFCMVSMGDLSDSFNSMEARVANSFLNGRRILAVDDVAENRELIEIILLKSGATVDVAENGHEAIIKASASEYDVILMDMEMPQGNGLNAVIGLRKMNYKGTIIALSAHAMSSYVDAAIAAGCNDYMMKPFHSHELLEKILAYCSK
jgi:CheY-like chemotaxis protein